LTDTVSLLDVNIDMLVIPFFIVDWCACILYYSYSCDHSCICFGDYYPV